MAISWQSRGPPGRSPLLCRVQGTRSFGMEPQPDLYVTGAVAVVALVLLDQANKKLDDPKKKRR